MKLRLFLIAGALLLLPLQAHAEDTTETVTLQPTPATLVHLIKRPNNGGQWLIRVGTGCDKPLTSQKAQLTVRNSLNGNQDFISTSANHKCAVKYAFEINETLKVSAVYPSNRVAILTDKTNRRFRVSYGEENQCDAIGGFRRGTIYAYRFDEKLATNDYVYVPGQSGHCTLSYVEEIVDTEKTSAPVSTQDIKIPTVVKDVKAVSGNTKLYVQWDKAEDNVGILYYWVRVTPYKSDPKDLPKVKKATDIQTAATHITLRNLMTDEQYYIYVLAIDKSGNPSEKWSEPAVGQTRSSIPEL
jgi:hypothetical protein